jgi:hypothetical protein
LSKSGGIFGKIRGEKDMEEKKTVRKVKAKWVVGIPKDAKVLVKNGDEVNEGQLIVEIKIRDEKIFNLSAEYGGLSNDNWEQLRSKLQGLAAKEGELLFGPVVVFGKKPISPLSGQISKIDEFRNIYVRGAGEKVKNIICPVDAKVSKLDEESLVLEFKAEEYPGEGLTEGRVWGNGGLKFVEHLTELSVKDAGKIILVDELIPAMLIKALVVGIGGVVVIDSGVKDGVKIATDLPILKVDGDGFFRLRKFAVDENTRVLLNASGGRLLLCQK